MSKIVIGVVTLLVLVCAQVTEEEVQDTFLQQEIDVPASDDETQEEILESIDTMLSDPNMTCANGKTNPYPYERSSGCIGGRGGGPFSYHKNSPNQINQVKKLQVWLGAEQNGFKAVRMTLFDGTSFVAGGIPDRGPDGQYTFKEDEHLIGDYILGGNGIGTRTGYLEFQTTKGKFKVGDLHTPYYQKTGDSFFTGMYGMHGSEIDHMGFYVMKPLKKIRMINVTYPSLDSLKKPNKESYKTNLCNETSRDQSMIAAFTRTEGEDYQWSIQTSLKFGSSLEVSAGIPGIAELKGTAHWEVGITGSYSESKHSSTIEKKEMPVTVPPREIVQAHFLWWDEPCKLTYKAEMEYTFTDGQVVKKPTSGQYKGKYINQQVEARYVQVKKLKKGETCDDQGEFEELFE